MAATDSFSTAFDAALRQTLSDALNPKIAVAVSGGGDSMALALLLRDWVRKNGGEILALTVDHALRKNSAQEAEETGKRLAEHGIAHRIMLWDEGKPQSGLQEQARIARYHLLLRECRKSGFPLLAVAHNAEDQMETFWMRLAHGSGLDGLCGMAPVTEKEGIRIIRPLLGFSREELRDVCKNRGVAWAEDPSNENAKFLRVRLRAFEELLAAEGLSPQRLSRTLQKLNYARESLRFVERQVCGAVAVSHPEGYTVMNVTKWREYPGDIRRRVLLNLLQRTASQRYPSGFEALEELIGALQAPDFQGRTLDGCEIFPSGEEDIVFCREFAAVETRVAAFENAVWDGRFTVSGLREEGLEIGVLGDDGLAQRKKAGFSSSKELPFKIRRTLPALWRGQELWAVPHLGYRHRDCQSEGGFLSILLTEGRDGFPPSF